MYHMVMEWMDPITRLQFDRNDLGLQEMKGLDLQLYSTKDTRGPQPQETPQWLKNVETFDSPSSTSKLCFGDW